MKTRGIKNHKMNDAVYKQRRQVIDCIYKLKSALRAEGLKLPRIEVRIGVQTKGYENFLAWGKMTKCETWYSEDALAHKNLMGIVAHEIGHAWLGLEHDENCPLMCKYANDMTTDINKMTAVLREGTKNN